MMRRITNRAPADDEEPNSPDRGRSQLGDGSHERMRSDRPAEFETWSLAPRGVRGRPPLEETLVENE